MSDLNCTLQYCNVYTKSDRSITCSKAIVSLNAGVTFHPYDI